MYLLTNVKKENFKKKREGSERIQTMDSSIERNFWTEAWNFGRAEQCVVEQKDNHEERTLDQTRWQNNCECCALKARILVRIYLINVYFRAILRNKVTILN